MTTPARARASVRPTAAIAARIGVLGAAVVLALLAAPTTTHGAGAPSWTHAPNTYDVVYPPSAERLGLQLSPTTLEVVAFDHDAVAGRGGPGTSGMVRLKDRLVAVNGIPLAYRAPQEALRILADADAPKVLTFAVAGQPRTQEMHAHFHASPTSGLSPSFTATIPTEGASKAEPGTRMHTAEGRAAASGAEAAGPARVCGEHASAAYDFELTFNGNEALGLTVSRDLFVLAFDGVTADGSDAQVWEGGAVHTGDRIIGVGDQCLLHVPSAMAIDVLRDAFVPQPKEAVRCRGPGGSVDGSEGQPGSSGVYCSVERLPRSYAPRTVLFRPATATRRSSAVPGVDDDGAWNNGFDPVGAGPSAGGGGSGGGNGGGSDGGSGGRASSGSFSDLAGTVVIHESVRGDAVSTSYEFVSATFTGALPCRLLPVKVADPPEACGRLVNEDELGGAAVLVRRGDCFFSYKARQVQETGAAAILVYTPGSDDDLIRMPAAESEAAGLAIASVMVPAAAGERVVKAMQRYDARQGAVSDVQVEFVSASHPGACSAPEGASEASDAAATTAAAGGGRRVGPSAGAKPYADDARAAHVAGGLGGGGPSLYGDGPPLPRIDPQEVEQHKASSQGANALLGALLSHRNAKDRDDILGAARGGRELDDGGAGRDAGPDSEL